MTQEQVEKLVEKARRMGLRPVRDTDTNEWLDGYDAACNDILAALTKGRGKERTVMERTEETLKARVRETPLPDRLNECRKRIGNMCAEGRAPRMCIPVQHSDDDFFICTTLADAQAQIEALQRELDELREATKVICGHCCEPMAIPSKAILQSHLSTLQGLVETIKCELFDRYDGAPDSPTRWMGSLIRDIEIAQALPATPTERGEDHSGDDTDMVQKEGGDGE